MRSNSDLAVPVRSLAGDTVLCSWSRYLTLIVPLKCVPVNLVLEYPCEALVSHPGYSRNASNQVHDTKPGNKRRPDEHFGYHADFKSAEEVLDL